MCQLKPVNKGMKQMDFPYRVTTEWEDETTISWEIIMEQGKRFGKGFPKRHPKSGKQSSMRKCGNNWVRISTVCNPINQPLIYNSCQLVNTARIRKEHVP